MPDSLPSVGYGTLVMLLVVMAVSVWLGTQAQKAVKQATKRMLANKTSRKLVAEEVARNRKARQVVAREMADEELLAELKRRGLGG